MNRAVQVFDLLDTWRHLPNYQLERRADIYFALYLPEVLEIKLGLSFNPLLIPEFPIRIGTIYPNIKSNKSVKVDYLALSNDRTSAVLVELKTDDSSRRENQDKHMLSAKQVGFANLLEGVKLIFPTTNKKKKYLSLYKSLESLELLSIPSSLDKIMRSSSHHGINQAISDIQISSNVTEIFIIYVQPNGSGPSVINFYDFANVVKEHDDPLSQRFASSLVDWAAIKAGEGYIHNG